MHNYFMDKSVVIVGGIRELNVEGGTIVLDTIVLIDWRIFCRTACRSVE